MNARQPFCWWMTFTKLSNPFLPPPPKWLTWPLDVCGGGVYAWFSWGNNFFPNLWSKKFFAPDITVKDFFFLALYVMSNIFFSAGYCFPQKFLCILFSFRSQAAGYVSLKSPINPSKVKYSAPKIHQTFAQLTDFDLSIISKAFWNKLPRESVRTDVRWRHNQNFLDG